MGLFWVYDEGLAKWQDETVEKKVSGRIAAELFAGGFSVHPPPEAKAWDFNVVRSKFFRRMIPLISPVPTV